MKKIFFRKITKNFFFQGPPLCMKKWELRLSIIVTDHMVWLSSYFFMCYNYTAHGRYHLVHRWMKIGQSEKVLGVKGKMTHFTPLSAYSFNIFQQNSVQKCMTIMCIIVTEEDLFKKHAKKGAFFCPFSILPHKCCPAAV